MNFDVYFKFTSYAVVACGALALLASGGISVFLTVIFAVLMIAGWRLEGTKWQISERFGLVLIVLALPLYYLDWQSQAALLARERAGAATLAHLILGLSVVKLFQIKNDRDWVFLYLISFFEVLLAAGLSVSPMFLATLILYLLFAICTIIAFEIRKASRLVKIIETEESKLQTPGLSWRLPVTATMILLTISFLAVPAFFMMPRIGGTGFGGGGGGGLSGFVGFSDSVKLGSIGRLQQNNEVVMRVRVESEGATWRRDLRWRGVALDYFDNQGWRNTLKRQKEIVFKDDKGFFQIGKKVKQEDDLTLQTIYLEPIDTAVLFGASRIVAVQGNFPSLQKDVNSSVTLPRNFDRVVYKVFSDTALPDAKVLRADKTPYQPFEQSYLQLPPIDGRIPALAKEIIEKAGAKNRYDAARAIENHLQTEFGYTLDLKAEGREPLADFLFNVREGHCEYFATAMAVMLRTQGIATRVVNGFQRGEYNDAAGAFIVTQKEAHSWVEVYFPESDSWVTFDPTPAAGQNLSEQESAGNFVSSQINKYMEALNMFWLQYVVAYDSQEQRSLARVFRETLVNNQESAGNFWQIWRERVKDWWDNLNGARGAAASRQTIAQTVLAVLLTGGAIILLWFIGKRVSWQRIWRLFTFGRQPDAHRIVEFYQRMTTALAKKGLRRATAQTPLEFAAVVGAGEALQITEAYNRVRFGAENLTHDEAKEIEIWLRNLEGG
ncbi:MAG: transglutaminaseTgpA domain-containing protein [Pyrinomonadaceae bacterium]